MSKMTPTKPLPEHFPLDSLGPLLGKYTPPEGTFVPGAAWTQTYGVYTLAGRKPGGRRIGELELRRTVDGRGGVAIHVHYDRSLTGGAQKTVGTIHTRVDDTLNQPGTWNFQTQLLDAAGKPIARTGQTKTGKIVAGVVQITDAAGTRQHKVPGRCAMNWGLFDAVQRLGGEKTKPLAFTLIDHFDQVKPEYTLSYRKMLDVPVGKRKIRLTAYDQLGRGNVPWVYWVDPRGRLLFVVAGLEAYMLETSRQRSALLPM